MYINSCRFYQIMIFLYVFDLLMSFCSVGLFIIKIIDIDIRLHENNRKYCKNGFSFIARIIGYNII